MADLPERAYVTTSDGGSVAYQVSGAGPVDVLILQATGVPLDVLWEAPGLIRVRDRFDAFSRSVWLEPRGWGSSDRDVTPARSLEEEVTNEQLTAVADAVGSERFALLGFAPLGPWALRYGAHPERVSALVLNDTLRATSRRGMSLGISDRLIEHQIAGFVAEMWGPDRRSTSVRAERMTTSCATSLRGEISGDPAYAGNGSGSHSCRMRDCLSSIRVPTLVLHRRGTR